MQVVAATQATSRSCFSLIEFGRRVLLEFIQRAAGASKSCGKNLWLSRLFTSQLTHMNLLKVSFLVGLVLVQQEPGKQGNSILLLSGARLFQDACASLSS